MQLSMECGTFQVSEVADTISELARGSLTWEDVTKKYPKFETKAEDK